MISIFEKNFKINSTWFNLKNNLLILNILFFDFIFTALFDIRIERNTSRARVSQKPKLLKNARRASALEISNVTWTVSILIPRYSLSNN